MDEQDRLVLEQRLADVLRRDLGSLSVRPFAMYNESARILSVQPVHPLQRLLSIAGTAVAVVLLIGAALGAAVALRELRSGGPPANPGASATVSPSPSSTPSTTPISTPSPSPSAVQSPAPTAIGFVLPAGCSYVGSPVVGTDQTQWQFTCGSAADTNARGALAPAFTQQGWVSCGAGLANATWAKGTNRLIVSEGSGAPGEYPKLSQPRPGIATACP